MIKITKHLLLISILSSALCLLSFRLSGVGIYAQSNDEKLQDLNNQIQQYEDQLNKLSSQASTLSNQIAQYDAQIKLTTLKISQTEEKIFLLGGRIDQLETSLQALNNAFTSRVVQTYKMNRLNEPVFMVLLSRNLNDAVSSYHYLKLIQESDRDLLVRLQTTQTNYKDQKQDQENLQKQLESQKNTLDAQKTAKANLLIETRNNEKKYQQLLAEAKAQLSALRRFVTSQGGASILQNQTKCDSWGCYYNQRDAQWGNIGLGGSSYSVAEYGCLVSSVAMLATHSGKNINPGDIAQDPSSFVPGTGYLFHSFSVNGVSVTINSASKDQLDSQLASGKPVIAGLFSGPDHFIVILRKEGDKYIMNDPFLENGSERPLTDKYNVSDINSLRLVSFN